MKTLILSLALLCSAQQTEIVFRPDPKLTPGEINPNVTQENIMQTVCRPGWTATVRPKTFYTTNLKLKQMALRNLPGKPSEYEEDHNLPLCLAGNPTSELNLWPQTICSTLTSEKTCWGAKTKDKLEVFLNHCVCKSSNPWSNLEKAQIYILKDWYNAYLETKEATVCPEDWN